MSWLRWFIGLTLPGFLLAALGLGALWLEYRTQTVAARLGDFLLQHNRDRRASGAVWRSIQARRESRSSLEHTTPADTLELETIPAVLWRFQYETDQSTANLLVLRARRRASPLRLNQVNGQEMQHLARSLQTYHQGENLLSRIELSREAFRAQALIQARIALEDGSLFSLLHQKLLATNAPEAWNFVKMSREYQDYWQNYLEPFLTSSGADPTEFQDTPSALSRACRSLLASWESSLYTAEVDRLQQAWNRGTDMEIRMVRNLDAFTGYALVGDELPVRFTLPAGWAEAALGPPALREEEP